jgi:Domain of unknown function (DUF4395)
MNQPEDSMAKIQFQFGEHLPGYSVPVLNERAVRSAAGILFFIAIVTFMNAMLLGNFQPTRVFVVAFLIDFTLRIFVNPKLSPSLILGQWVVRKQEPEYVGAPQKRFAWAIGFTLALLMLYLIVIKGVIGPINMLVCGTCLLLLFFESSFGICIGCKLYDMFSKNKVELCPGNVCSYKSVSGAGGTWVQGMVLLVFLVAIFNVTVWVYGHPTSPAVVQDEKESLGAQDQSEIERCRVPEFAKKIGHEQQWKLHNGCM